MTVKDKISGRDNTKELVLKSNGEILFSSKYHSYDMLRRYLDKEVTDEFINREIHALNIINK